MTENEQNAKIFKAFCDANRLKILGLLQNGEKCACQLLEQLDIGQPALSHHMKILCDAEIVVGEYTDTILPCARTFFTTLPQLFDHPSGSICHPAQ